MYNNNKKKNDSHYNNINRYGGGAFRDNHPLSECSAVTTTLYNII